MPNASSTKTGVNCEHLKNLIREVPDFPKPGILFYDITTLLKDKVGFATLIDALSAHYMEKDIDLILGIEARGFIFGPAIAYRLNAGFVPVRKPKKLPAATAKWTYDLEYGSDTLEIHQDAVQRGQRVLIVDDLLATRGTANACAQPAAGKSRAGVFAECLSYLAKSASELRSALIPDLLTTRVGTLRAELWTYDSASQAAFENASGVAVKVDAVAIEHFVSGVTTT